MGKKVFTSESWEEFTTGIANLKTKINNVINGNQVVSKATSATSATYSTNSGTATYSNNSAKATSATSATYASTANYAKAVASHNHNDATTATSGFISVADKLKLNATNIAFGTCDTAADTAAKVVTIVGNTNWTLTTGSLITVKFTNTNSATSPTLNVNGTGAKSIYYNNAEYTSSSSYGGYANRSITYQYDGTYWVFISWSYDSNSDTKVTQGKATTAATEYPVLLAYSSSTASVTNTVNKSSSLKYNPNTKILTVPTVKGNLTGNATSATLATSATYSTNSGTASYATSAGSASKATSATSATYATTATNAGTSTYASSAGSASNATNASTATYATSAGSASKATSATSATYASTANYAKAAPSATTATAGFMSSSDKTKLDGVATGANKYSHPTSSGNKHIPSGGSSGQILRWSADGTAAWGSDNNTTYGVVSTSADGLAPKRDGSTTKFLRADGTWAVPPDNNTTYTFNGAVSTIKDSNLTASRALISNSSGKVAVSSVTSTELGYLDGVTSAIQTQLNGKLGTSAKAADSSKLNGQAASYYTNSSNISFDNTYIKGLYESIGVDPSKVTATNVQSALNGCGDMFVWSASEIGNLWTETSNLWKKVNRFKTKDITVNNVKCTTKSNSGAYYCTVMSYADLGIEYGNIVSITPLNWTGAAASFTPYLHYSTGINVISDVSQTIGQVGIRVFYLDYSNG